MSDLPSIHPQAADAGATQLEDAVVPPGLGDDDLNVASLGELAPHDAEIEGSFDEPWDSEHEQLDGCEP